MSATASQSAFGPSAQAITAALRKGEFVRRILIVVAALYAQLFERFTDPTAEYTQRKHRDVFAAIEREANAVRLYDDRDDREKTAVAVAGDEKTAPTAEEKTGNAVAAAGEAKATANPKNRFVELRDSFEQFVLVRFRWRQLLHVHVPIHWFTFRLALGRW